MHSFAKMESKESVSLDVEDATDTGVCISCSPTPLSHMVGSIMFSRDGICPSTSFVYESHQQAVS